VESAELNRRRLRVLAPLMAALHAAHVAMFYVPAAVRASASADWVRWRTGILSAHAAMLPVVLGVTWLAWRGRSPSVMRAAGPVLATAYLVHGALCSGFDQIVVTTLTPYIGYCLGVAVIMALTPAEAIVAYAIGGATMVAMIFAYQRSTNGRLADLPNVLTANVVGVAIAWIQHAQRRRELAQKQTIDRQQEELNALNAGLERRVREQVAQLQAQVVARSYDLSQALARLALQRGVDEQVLATGTLLGGRFLIEEIIGEGGMGAVYAGLDQSSGARVAIKVIARRARRRR
jgi:FtsH-binding integral membrane protein